jgi:hypothetical protein
LRAQIFVDPYYVSLYESFFIALPFDR